MNVWEIRIHMTSDGKLYDTFSIWGVAEDAVNAALEAEKYVKENRDDEFTIVGITFLGEVAFTEKQ